MRLRVLWLLPAIAAILTACGNGGLGMRVKLEPAPMPAEIPAGASITRGAFSLALAGADDDSQELNELALSIPEKSLPAGTLTITALSVRNRTMDYPSRASGEIDATAIWQPLHGKTAAWDITVRTDSVPLETDATPQLQMLNHEARRGMIKALLKEI